MSRVIDLTEREMDALNDDKIVMRDQVAIVPPGNPSNVSENERG